MSLVTCKILVTNDISLVMQKKCVTYLSYEVSLKTLKCHWRRFLRSEPCATQQRPISLEMFAKQDCSPTCAATQRAVHLKLQWQWKQSGVAHYNHSLITAACSYVQEKQDFFFFARSMNNKNKQADIYHRWLMVRWPKCARPRALKNDDPALPAACRIAILPAETARAVNMICLV